MPQIEMFEIRLKWVLSNQLDTKKPVANRNIVVSRFTPNQMTTVIATLFCIVIFSGMRAASAQKLTEEGQLRKSAHDFLFQEFATSRKCDYSKDKSILKEIVVSTKRVVADGELIVELPEGSQRVASMFRHLVLRGENLDRVGSLSMHPYQTDSHLHYSIQNPEIYRVQMGTLPIPKVGASKIVLKAETTGPVVVTEIAFSSQNKLRTTFDDIPYRNLGDEHPVINVAVEIDATRECSIAGHVELERINDSGKQSYQDWRTGRLDDHIHSHGNRYAYQLNSRIQNHEQDHTRQRTRFRTH